MHRPEPNYNLASLVLRQADLSRDRTAIIFEETETSYGEFATRVRALAGKLRAQGVCLGDRVGFLGFNQPAFLEVMFAANTLGAVFVPLNFRLTGEELNFIIGDAGVHTLVIDPELVPVIDGVRDRLPCRNYYSVGAGVDGYPGIDTGLDEAEPVQDAVMMGAHDTLLIMYTSGTTGLPKGAMLTHGNIAWNNINAMYALGGNRDDVSLTVAPLFHIGGLNVMTLTSLQMGAPLVLLRHFDPAAVLAAIERYQVNQMFGAPAMYLFMSQHPDFATANLESLRMLVVGAAPCPESLILTYGERGIKVSQGYGLTETAPFASFLPPDKALEKVGSAGTPPVMTDVRIVNNDNQPLPTGERGEICVRGPNIMKGYWNRPDATAKAIDAEGWFHSGDVGYFDEDGYLFICDRLKDMVISGGENVYPAEVESVLYTHPAIAEVAVIGLPDEKWGEAVTAVVALHAEQTLELAALREFAEPHLARYKLPLRLHVVDALPRNPAGKVLKFKLRDSLV